jgi:hypothetical protein
MLMRFLTVLLFVSIAPLAMADGPIFSRGAAPLNIRCEAEVPCKDTTVPSPDAKKAIHVVWNGSRGSSSYTLQVFTPSGRFLIERDGLFSDEDDWTDLEILWSPNSESFSLTGHTNGYLNTTHVFRFTGSGVIMSDIAREPFQDMLRTFPPCKAEHADPTICSAVHSEDYFNFAVVAWADAHTAVLMGEVPCDSLWGGIMCQVMGYEVDVPSGKIVRRMTAVEFRKRWQHALAWKFHVPGPPEWEK